MSFYKQLHDFVLDTFVTQTHGYIDMLQKKEIWQDFARKTGGEFIIKQTRSKDLTSFELKISDESGTIEFTESDTHPLKVVSTFFAKNPIIFSLFQKDFEDKIASIFKTKNLEFSHPEFDKKYVVKSSDKIAIRKILSQQNVIPIILKSNLYSITSHVEGIDNNQPIICIVGHYVNSVIEIQEILELMLCFRNELSI